MPIYFNRMLQSKTYELKDHLGNVRLLFTDLRDQDDLDLRAAYTYYPFGMLMPEMYHELTDNRYGFNGMERDPEIKEEGNSYTTHYRQNDPRLGRWLSIDPKAVSFPGVSPYVSMGNNPIMMVDPLGMIGF